MYASCAWFFDDIAGLEASLVIRIGAHALDLMRQAGGTPPVREVLEALAEGKSNLPEAGTGADVFRKVAAHQVTATPRRGRRGAGGAGRAAGLRRCRRFPGSMSTLSGHLEEQPSGVRRLEGTARARQRRLGTSEELGFAGDHPARTGSSRRRSAAGGSRWTIWATRRGGRW